MFRNQEREANREDRKYENLQHRNRKKERTERQRERERKEEGTKKRKGGRKKERKIRMLIRKKMGQCPNDVKGEISIIKCISVDER